MSTPTPTPTANRLHRPHGPRPPPETSRDVPPLPISIVPTPPQWPPLVTGKKLKGPKLQIQPIAPPPPALHEDHLAPPGSDIERTLRAPGSRLDDFNELRVVLNDIRPKSRAKSRERSSVDHSIPPPDGDAPSAAPSATDAQPKNSGYDDEAFSDDVIVAMNRLGEGAGGAVYKVRDTRTNLIYARKTIPTRTTPARQLMAELRHLSDSQHENICQFYGAYMSGSSEVNVIMEYCEGGSLEAIAQRIKEKNLRTNEPIIGKLAEGILTGLTHLHSLRIIHRDIKPSNILLTIHGVVKLADFGVSGELIDSVAQTFTGTGFYMAPERINGEPYTVRADVWSTGLSLLELAQNRFPIPEEYADGIIALMDYVTRGPPIELQDDDSVTWSDQMKDFIRQCLRPDPRQRPYPRDLLKHPWIEEASTTVQTRRVGQWVRAVWDIKRTKSAKAAQGSRPVSRQEVEDALSASASQGNGGDSGHPTSHSSGDLPPWEQ